MNVLSTTGRLARHDRSHRTFSRAHSARGSLLVAATLAVASLGAVAQTVAPLSRAEVTSELQRARAAGEIEHGMSESFGLVWLQDRDRGADVRSAQASADETPGLTREQVKAELIRARNAGEMDDASAEVNVPQSGGTNRPTSLAGTGH